MENEACSCGTFDTQLVVSCSGAADLGYIADRIARRMSLEKVSKMSCLALFVTCEDKQIENFKDKKIQVIDGCSLDCAKKVMVQRGIDKYDYVRLTDLGYEKGKTNASIQIVNEIYNKVLDVI